MTRDLSSSDDRVAVDELVGRLLALCPDLELDPWVIGSAATRSARLEAATRALARVVDSYLESDRARLAQLLYAADVPERAVDAEVADTRLEHVPWVVAAMIVDRLAAAATRAGRYAVSNPDDEFS